MDEEIRQARIRAALAAAALACAMVIVTMLACSCDVDTESTSHIDDESVAHEQAPLDVTPYRVPDYARNTWSGVMLVTDMRTNQRWWLLQRCGSDGYAVLEVR